MRTVYRGQQLYIIFRRRSHCAKSGWEAVEEVEATIDGNRQKNPPDEWRGNYAEFIKLKSIEWCVRPLGAQCIHNRKAQAIFDAVHKTKRNGKKFTDTIIIVVGTGTYRVDGMALLENWNDDGEMTLIVHTNCRWHVKRHPIDGSMARQMSARAYSPTERKSPCRLVAITWKLENLMKLNWNRARNKCNVYVTQRALWYFVADLQNHAENIFIFKVIAKRVFSVNWSAFRFSLCVCKRLAIKTKDIYIANVRYRELQSERERKERYRWRNGENTQKRNPFTSTEQSENEIVFFSSSIYTER